MVDIIRCGGFMGEELRTMHAVLVSGLGDDITSAEAYSAGDILLPTLMPEIGILAVEGLIIIHHPGLRVYLRRASK